MDGTPGPCLSDNCNLNERMKIMKGSIAKLHSTVVDLLLQSMEGSSDKLDAPVVDLMLWSMDPCCAPPGTFEMCAPPVTIGNECTSRAI
jgi:tetrahydromethanopterin S-methyltransferase subunit B